MPESQHHLARFVPTTPYANGGWRIGANCDVHRHPRGGRPLIRGRDLPHAEALAVRFGAMLILLRVTPAPGGVPEEDWNSASAIEDPDGAGPRIDFQRVPEAKAVKNRLHLDLHVGGERTVPPEERRRRIDLEAERLVRLGATRVEARERLGEVWLVMQDPDGNEFCLT